MLLLAGSLQAQVITDAVQINHVDSLRFVELIQATGSIGTKYKISLDYGNIKTINRFNGQKLKSFVHALHFMDDYGWEYVSAYTTVQEVAFSGTLYWFHFVFKKKE